jgi:hypothetical protein
MDIRLLAEVEPWEWPEGARATLLRALTDEETASDEGLLAAELAGDTTVINDEIAEALLGIADRSDAFDQLRCQAAISLGPSLEDEDVAASAHEAIAMAAASEGGEEEEEEDDE